MKLHKTLIFSLIIVLIFSCNGKQSATKSPFSLEPQIKNHKIQKGVPFKIALVNNKNRPIDKIEYLLDGATITVEENTLSLTPEKLGDHQLQARIFSEGEWFETATVITVLADVAPQVYTYTILNEFPHDINAYTQGLEFHDGALYESTGRRGQSSLRKTDFTTGEVLQKIDLEDQYFGEGITIMNSKIYQLTWQRGVGFTYNLDNFEKISSFKYNQSKEGWGLTNNGEVIFKSDGTDKIWILDPETLAETDHLQCVTNTSVFNKANELEYVDGKIYANVYLKDSAMIIDATSGAIIGVIDFRGLKSRVSKHKDLDVLNGIAYHPERKTFFVTGKNWDKMFEVSILLKE